MKKLLMVLFVFLLTAQLKAQVDVSAGMGINYWSAPSLNDYINSYIAVSSDQMPSFSTNVEFYGEAGLNLPGNLQVGLDYAYLIYSYNTNNGKVGKYDFTYNMHMPTLTAYYVLQGPGYKFKFGGGAGYRVALFTEKFYNSIGTYDYKARGVGFLLKADGNTSLGGNLYANIALLLRFDFLGKPTSDNNSFLPGQMVLNDISFNSYSAGLRLGMTYFF
ncbi:MAG: hypothetical protein ACM3RX_04695 [Methanococcaceae archaeon]